MEELKGSNWFEWWSGSNDERCYLLTFRTYCSLTFAWAQRDWPTDCGGGGAWAVEHKQGTAAYTRASARAIASEECAKRIGSGTNTHRSSSLVSSLLVCPSDVERTLDCWCACTRAFGWKAGAGAGAVVVADVEGPVGRVSRCWLGAGQSSATATAVRSIGKLLVWTCIERGSGRVFVDTDKGTAMWLLRCVEDELTSIGLAAKSSGLASRAVDGRAAEAAGPFTSSCRSPERRRRSLTCSSGISIATAFGIAFSAFPTVAGFGTSSHRSVV